MFTCMVTKNITIMEDVYKLLKAVKRANESFSDMLRREIGERTSILEFAGAWSGLSDAEVSAIKEDIRDMRKKGTKELLGRV